MKRATRRRYLLPAVLSGILAGLAARSSGAQQPQLQTSSVDGGASSKTAQEAPVNPAGVQVGTEQTPAAAANADELRKQAQNPIASLISVPIQNNSNFSFGPQDRTQDILNIQPVIPMQLGQNWNLVTRVIMPIFYQPTAGEPLNQGAYGFSDINPSFFFSPRKAHKIIWGAGPTFLLPTATNRVLGQGKWGAGPALVVLTQPGKWTLGVLVNNIWSFTGQADRADVNQMTMQVFINYNLPHGWYLASQPIFTANWEATHGGRWVVPVGGGVGRIMKLGFQPVNISVQFYGNAVYPPGGSPWSMRLQFVLLFPKLNKQQEKAMLEQKLKQMEQEQAPKN